MGQPDGISEPQWADILAQAQHKAQVTPPSTMPEVLRETFAAGWEQGRHYALVTQMGGFDAMYKMGRSMMVLAEEGVSRLPAQQRYENWD